jgi:hypothetical protein
MKVRKSEGLNNLIVIEISIGRGNRPLALSGKVDTDFTRQKGNNKACMKENYSTEYWTEIILM